MKQDKIQKKPRTLGIRTRLIGVIVPIVIVIIVAFFALSRGIIIRLSEDKLMAQSKVCAESIYAWTEKIFSEFQIYKDTIESGIFANDEEILAFMETSVEKSDAYPIGLYMGDDSGVYLDGSGWVPDDDWVLTERDWYLDGKEYDAIAFGEPYFDAQSGMMCVSACVRMNYPEAVRVLAVDVYLDYVSELITEMEKDEVKSFLVTRQSQTVVAHADADMVARTLDEDGLDSLYGHVGSEMSRGETQLLTMRGDMGEYFVCMNEIPGTDWMLVSYVSKADVLSGLRQLELIMVIIAAIAAVVLIVVTLRLMNRVVKPVAKVTDVIQKVSDGDFSQNIEVKGNDEIAVMSAQTQDFLVQMRKTITDITEIAKWLEQQSEENDRVSGSLMDSSRSQKEAMVTLNSKVEELSQAAGHVAEQMQQFAKIIEEANCQGENAGRMMQETVAISESGRKSADRVSEGMHHIEESISSLSEQIMQTDAAVEKIGSMVEMIVDVAEETNLLSLNASIEAARAGDAGRGFAIVAEQIGKLAINSGGAADDISRLTTEIKDAMHQAIDKMAESVTEVKASAELVGENRKNFEAVFEKVGETDQTVEQMVKLVGEAEAVASSMQRVAENQVLEADAITKSAQELNRYTQTVNDDSVTVAENARELEMESKKLMEQVKRFRI